MKQYEEKLKKYMGDNNIQGEHLSFNESCHSVQEAADAAGAKPEDFIKSICMMDAENRLIVAIVKGNDRASTSRVSKALQIDIPRTATESEVLEKTGFLCGGVPAFGYEAVFLIDPNVMISEVIYTGGGSPNSLVRMTTQEMAMQNRGQVVRVRK